MEASRCHLTHLVLLLSFTALARGQRLRANVTLIDNGYEGLLIAIGPDVPENPKLIPRIKEYFVEMSQLLFAATKRRAYLRDITILVPKTWTENPAYRQAGLEAFEKANIIIDKSNGVQGDNPYVKQKGECGQPGTFMHLTPKFVLDDTVAAAYGTPPAKTVLHEWGHLRWGLFDEYPVDENDAHFYHDSITGRIEGVRCSRGVTGKEYKRVNDYVAWNCNPDEETNLPESACRFAPDVYNNEGATSIMSHHYVTSVIGFCDNNKTDKFDLHNDQAPNRQNRLCGGRSAWEVMREHDDFKNNNNPPVQGNIDTSPTFKLVQEQPKRYVLVLDVSGSMTGSRLENLKKACAEFLLNTVDEDSQVGIVQFSLTAAIIQHLETLSSNSVREHMVSVVNGLAAGGRTCIGCGLRKGIEVLEYNNMAAAGGILVVVSDGGENEYPNITNVKPDLLRKGVLVDTLLFTASADEQLISLAKDTGGMSFFESGDSQSTSLTDAFSKTVTQRNSAQKEVLAQILSESFTVPDGGSSFEGSIYIDSTIGNNTRFLFTWSTGSITVTLRAPDNVTITQNSASGVLSIDINGTAKVGKWLYTVTNSDSGNTVQVQVSSRPSSDAAPIVLSASVSSDTVDIADTSLSRIVIYGEVTQGYTPVVGATVVAYVDASNGKTHTLQLLDNGAGADNTKNDGIYSAYFLKFKGNVTHSVRVVVKGEDGVSVKTVAGGQKASPIITNTTAANATKLEVAYTPIEPFERSDSGGLFTVKNLPTSTNDTEPPDLYPPGRIYDLVLAAVNTDNKTVTLSWTATGDDLDQGNASSYIIRYSTSVSQLRLNFNNTYKLLDEDLIQGKLDSPLPAGAKETFLVQFNQTVKANITYSIALLALDDKNQTGQVSNIVSVSFVYSYPLPPAAPVTSTEATTEAITTTTVFTTQESTTNEPTTHGRTTEPTTQEITTTEPTTLEITTTEPTTLEITTTVLTTQESTTTEPTTQKSTITEPTTLGITTTEPTTQESTTTEPTTQKITTTEQTTQEITTTEPTTQEITTTEPTTQEATTTEPTTQDITTTEPTDQEITTTVLTTQESTTTEPATQESTKTEPTTQESTKTEPTTQDIPTTEPTTQKSTTTEPTTQESTTNEPTTQEILTTEPWTQEATTTEPSTQQITTTESTARITTEPTIQEPITQESTLYITTTGASSTHTDSSRVTSFQQIAIGTGSAAVALVLIVLIAVAIAWPDKTKPKDRHSPDPRHDGVKDGHNIHGHTGSHPVNPYEFRNYWQLPHEDKISRPYVHQAKQDKVKSDYRSAFASYTPSKRTGYSFPDAPMRIVSHDYTPSQFKADVKQTEVPRQRGYYNFRNDPEWSNQKVSTVDKEHTYVNISVGQIFPTYSAPMNATEHGTPGVRRVSSGKYNRYIPVEQAEIASESKPYWKTNSQDGWNRNPQHPERRKDTQQRYRYQRESDPSSGIGDYANLLNYRMDSQDAWLSPYFPEQNDSSRPITTNYDSQQSAFYPSANRYSKETNSSSDLERPPRTLSMHKQYQLMDDANWRKSSMSPRNFSTVYPDFDEAPLYRRGTQGSYGESNRSVQKKPHLNADTAMKPSYEENLYTTNSLNPTNLQPSPHNDSSFLNIVEPQHSAFSNQNYQPMIYTDSYRKKRNDHSFLAMGDRHTEPSSWGQSTENRPQPVSRRLSSNRYNSRANNYDRYQYDPIPEEETSSQNPFNTDDWVVPYKPDVGNQSSVSQELNAPSYQSRDAGYRSPLSSTSNNYQEAPLLGQYHTTLIHPHEDYYLHPNSPTAGVISDVEYETRSYPNRTDNNYRYNPSYETDHLTKDRPQSYYDDTRTDTGYTPGVSQYGNRGSQDWRGFRELQASTSTRNNTPPVVDRTTKPSMEIPQVALKMPLAHLTGRNYPYIPDNESPRYTIYK